MNVGNKGGAKPNTPSKALAPRKGTPPPIPYSEVKASRCKVCQSPYRREIDMLLVSGWHQTDVARHFNQVMGEEFFSKMNISRHARLHLDARDAAVRRIIEKRARQELGDIDAIEGSIVTKSAVLETVIQRALEQLNAGVMELKGQDIISAIEKLEKLESEFKDTAIDEMMQEFKAFAKFVQEEVGEERFKEIFAKFEKAMDDRSRPALLPVEYPTGQEIEGEATEEDDE
jgi:hypothetical protein